MPTATMPDGDWTRAASVALAYASAAGGIFTYLVRKIEGVRKETASAMAAHAAATESALEKLRVTDAEMARDMVRHDELDRLGAEVREQGKETRAALAGISGRIDTFLERLAIK